MEPQTPGWQEIIESQSFLELILNSHSRHVPYSTFQLESYNQFVKYDIKRIIDEYRNFTCNVKNERHTLDFGRVVVGYPVHSETNGETHLVLPHECLSRGLNYMSPVFADILHKTYTTNEETEEEELTNERIYREVPLFLVPVMVKSVVCNVNNDAVVGDICTEDQGGYFIIRGNERCIILQESLRKNCIFVFETTARNTLIHCECRSVHESKLRSTSTIKMFLMMKRKNMTPNIVIELPFLTTTIDFLTLLRFLLDDETMEISKLYETVYTIIENNFHDDPDRIKIMEFVKQIIQSSDQSHLDDLYNSIGQLGTKSKNMEQRKRYIQHLLINEVFPHIGLDNSDDVKWKKIHFLCRMLVRVVKVYFKKEQFNDRDNYKNKRVHSCGTMLSLLFRQLYRKFLKYIRGTLMKNVLSGKFINIAEIVDNRQITSALLYSMSTGNWSVSKNNSTLKVGISQLLSRMNKLSIISHIRRCNTPSCRDGKRTEIRQLHTSHRGIFCCFETPEGQSCGLLKAVSMVATVRQLIPADIIIKWIHIRFSEYVTPFDPCSTLPMIWVNGIVICCIRDPTLVDEIVFQLRNARRMQVIGKYISITKHKKDIIICSDADCLVRPLLVASKLNEFAKIMYEYTQIHQTFELWEYLMDCGCIEFVDKCEEDNLLIASVPADVTPEHTHLLIHPSVELGHCASQICHLNHNQAPRNIYESTMCKQSEGVACMNFNKRMDTQSYTLHYPQKPLVRTLCNYDLQLMPTTTNVIVCISPQNGYNQEDSIVFNQAAIDRGLFHSTHSFTVKDSSNTSLDKCSFENPQMQSNCVGLKSTNYDSIRDNGLPIVGKIINKNEAVIGQTIEVNDPDTGGTMKRDGSKLWSNDYPVRVDKVLETINRDRTKIVKVKLSSYRVPQTGDKFCSMHGQKGTIGICLPPEDLPRTVDGIIPDILINPSCVPSRMTIAQLIEMVHGKAAAMTGKFGNGTPFQKGIVDAIGKALHSVGFQKMGKERMYCGKTGEKLKALMFIGPCCYQKLRHHVVDKLHARTIGKLQTLTRQPVEGRSKGILFLFFYLHQLFLIFFVYFSHPGGGLRFGEMERDCVIAHGSSEILRERLLYSSDLYKMYVCRTCGQIAIPPHDTSYGNSLFDKPYCANATCRSDPENKIDELQCPYAFKLMLQELRTINVGMRLRLK